MNNRQCNWREAIIDLFWFLNWGFVPNRALKLWQKWLADTQRLVFTVYLTKKHPHAHLALFYKHIWLILTGCTHTIVYNSQTQSKYSLNNYNVDKPSMFCCLFKFHIIQCLIKDINYRFKSLSVHYCLKKESSKMISKDNY